MRNFSFYLLMAVLFWGISQGAYGQVIPFAFWNAKATSCTGGGYSYSGSCYYLGAAGADCFSTCSAYGGCLKTPTTTVADVKATCLSVLNGLGQSPSGYSSSSSYTYACAVDGSTYYYTSGSIQCGATATSTQRVCACGAGGTTQAGAATVNGYYFRLGAAAASCDTTCTSHGGCDITGTTYADSSGAICDSVLSALDVSTTGTSGGTTAVGCGYQSTTYRYLGTSTTTCAATLAADQRACACLSP